MRRLMPVPDQREDGAVIIMVAGFCVAMIAMAALVIDVGALLDERRQLQNGADASALGIAERCAVTGTCDVAGNATVATSLADANASDGAATVDSVTYPVPGQVTVATSTRAKGGGTILPYAFGQAITGQRGGTVHANATASWQGLRRATVIPLVMSLCEFNLATAPNNTVYNRPTVILFHSAAGQCSGPAGQDLPGGFGWVRDNSDSNPNDCNVTPTIGNTLQDDSGVPGTPFACNLRSLVGTDLLVPVYDSRTGAGVNGIYRIYGFAQFRLTGYRFSNSNAAGTIPCSPPNTCIGGSFIRFVPNGDLGGPTLGARPTLIS